MSHSVQGIKELLMIGANIDIQDATMPVEAIKEFARISSIKGCRIRLNTKGYAHQALKEIALIGKGQVEFVF